MSLKFGVNLGTKLTEHPLRGSLEWNRASAATKLSRNDPVFAGARMREREREREGGRERERALDCN